MGTGLQLARQLEAGQATQTKLQTRQIQRN